MTITITIEITDAELKALNDKMKAEYNSNATDQLGMLVGDFLSDNTESATFEIK